MRRAALPQKDGIRRLRCAAWDGFSAVAIARDPGEHLIIHDELALAVPLIDMAGSSVAIDGARLACANGHIGTHCVVPAGASLLGRWPNATDYLIVKFAADFSERFGEDGIGPPLRNLAPSSGVDDAVHRLSLLLRDELENGGARGRLYREALAIALAAAMTRDPRETPALAPSIARRMRPALDFMHDNLEHDIGIAALAGCVRLSPRQFTRQFRAALGVAPHQYLLDQRIARAKQLLSHGDQPMAVIAERCGFGTLSHFSRTFRARTGATPARFRAEA